MTNPVNDADILYQELCRKLAAIFQGDPSKKDKDAILALAHTADKELGSIARNPDVPRAQKYGCAIIVSLMVIWAAYARQTMPRLSNGILRLKSYLEKSSLSQSDAAIVRALVDQFETNQVPDLGDDIVNNANPDLYFAACQIRDLAPYVRVRDSGADRASGPHPAGRLT